MTHVSHAAFAAFVGLDWAATTQDVCRQTAGSATCACLQLAHTPAAIDAWGTTRRTRFHGQPVALCLARNQGPIVSALPQDEKQRLAYIRDHEHPTVSHKLPCCRLRDSPRTFVVIRAEETFLNVNKI